MPWEQGADYYLGAKGEPPGYWQGAGAAALGLGRRRSTPTVMRALYHEDIGPDGQVLGRRQRKANYPAGRRVAVQAGRGGGGPPEGRAGPVLHCRRRSGRSG